MDSGRVKITKEKKIIIYGASEAGRLYADLLRKIGYSIIAFLDRNAEKMKDIEDIPVYPPTTDKITMYDRANAIVIVTVLNAYTHDLIARELYKYGYENILFKHNILGEKNKATRELNRIYDSMYLKEDFLDVELPVYKSLNQERKKKPVLEKDNGYTVAYIPAEALFTSGKYYYENDVDISNLPMKLQRNLYQNVLYFVKPYALFKAMEENINDEEWCEYLDAYRMTREYESGSSNIDKNEWNRHFNDRYKVYQIMETSLMINPFYFIENPLSVVLRKDGKLEILDGVNRVGFFLAKKIYKFPCRLLNDAWDKYYNKEQVEKVTECIERYGEDVVYYPISHSAFVYYSSKEDILVQNIVMTINQYLVQKNILIQGMKVLDIGSKNGYFAQLYALMGADVTAFEVNQVQLELFNLENQLLGIEKIEIRDNLNECIKEDKYDIMLIHHDIYDGRNQVVDEFLKNFKGISFIETVEEREYFAEECQRLLHICIGEKILNLWVKNKAK